MPILLSDDILFPPSYDFVFKAVLTHPNAKPALMDLISACINRTVVDVQIRNNELPVGDANEKNERLDVNCVIDDGSQVNVEMQGTEITGPDNGYTGFINKTVYYLTDLHSSQKSKGVSYVDLVKTYQITFCMFDVFDHPEYITEASLRTNEGTPVSDQINIQIIELNKMNDILQKPVDEMTPLEMWSAFLGYAGDPNKRGLINELLEKKEEIKVAGTVLAPITKDEHERAKLLSQRKFETDYYNHMISYKEYGIKEGIEQGLEQGKFEERIIIAKNLKYSSFISIEQIAEVTGLSVSEIEEL